MNPHLEKLPNDFLYHIGYSREDAKQLFSDVKFVVMGGAPKRMGSFAEMIAKEIGHEVTDKEKLNQARTDRFAFFKIGPVLSISHGMGVPSVTILLHEVIKLLHYAEAKDPIIFRMGTCGGVGIPAGTVVVSNRAVNAFLKEEHVTVILGEEKAHPTVLDQTLAQSILDCQDIKSYQTILGTTQCTDDFYEGQSRIDGAFCDFTEQHREDHLKKLKAAGVDNIEMECTAIASLCHRAGVRAAIICVALLDRLKGTDQVIIKPEDYADYASRPQKLIARFIKTQLDRDSS